MHTFQPYPIDKMEFNPFTKIGKEWALVSAGDKTRCNTMTVSWGGVGVLWGKNVVFIFIRDSRYTKEFLDNGDLFSLSFLNEYYRDALNYCGSHSGRGEKDKFAAAGLQKLPGLKIATPVIGGAGLHYECKVAFKQPMNPQLLEKNLDATCYGSGDYHTIYFGQIQAAWLE